MPTTTINSLQTEMNRLFNSMFDAPAASGPRRWAPAMDLVETADSFVLRADLPGVKQEDVKIEIQDTMLTVAGERHPEHTDSEKGFHRIERSFGKFARTLTLPKGVDADAVTAVFTDGVLEVRIPKPEAVKPRRVEIAVGDQPAEIAA